MSYYAALKLAQQAILPTDRNKARRFDTVEDAVEAAIGIAQSTFTQDYQGDFTRVVVVKDDGTSTGSKPEGEAADKAAIDLKNLQNKEAIDLNNLEAKEALENSGVRGALRGPISRITLGCF